MIGAIIAKNIANVFNAMNGTTWQYSWQISGMTGYILIPARLRKAVLLWVKVP